MGFAGLDIDVARSEASMMNNMSLQPRFRALLRIIQRSMLKTVQRYVTSVDPLGAYGLFNVAAIALLSHKIIVIQLHQPLSKLGLILTTPCIFLFDLSVLLILHRLMASSHPVSKGVGCLSALIITICSGASASMYIQANAELSWTRSVDVFASWSRPNVGIVRLAVFSKFNGRGERSSSNGTPLLLHGRLRRNCPQNIYATILPTVVDTIPVPRSPHT